MQEKTHNQSNGIWSQWQADTYHQSSPKLAEYLSNYLNDSHNVIDFGCGNGFYIGELAKKGFNCVGVEGMKLNNFLHDQIIIKDLSQPFDLPIRGSVICLEVLEHIQKEFESTVIENITTHCNEQLVLSWALTGQPGVGHVNCVEQSYAIDRIVERGFKYLVRETEYARTQVDKNTDWFERTLLIFNRKGERG